MPKILVIQSNPDTQFKLRTDKEVKEINKVLNANPMNDLLCISFPAICIDELPALLFNSKPDILHFTGHGAKNYLIFEDDTGKGRNITSEALQTIFEECHTSIVCLFLSACSSKGVITNFKNIFPYIISFPDIIEDELAITFSKCFYQNLGLGMTFRSSFLIARGILKSATLKNSRLPELLENPAHSMYRTHLYMAPLLIAKFQLNKANRPKRSGNTFYFELDIKHLSNSVTEIIYEYIDISIKEEELFEKVTNLPSGTGTEFDCRGNILLRAWLWSERTSTGFVIQSTLTEALRNNYESKLPPKYQPAFNYINSN